MHHPTDMIAHTTAFVTPVVIQYQLSVSHDNRILGFFYMHHPKDMIAHTAAFVTPVVEHVLERPEKRFNIN